MFVSKNAKKKTEHINANHLVLIAKVVGESNLCWLSARSMMLAGEFYK